MNLIKIEHAIRCISGHNWGWCFGDRSSLNFKYLIPGALALSEMEEASNIMGLPSTSSDTSSHTSLTGQPKFRKLPFLLCFPSAFALHSGKHGFAKCGH